MTSRTPMGTQPRPPQRTLSSSSLSSQRPPHQQRSLSQQYHPSSPVRKDSVSDLSPDTPDGSQGRHATSNRRGISRLRLELSNDVAAMGALSAANSPQSLTPLRMQPLSDAMDGSTMSPASRTSQQDLDNPPMPMPKRRMPAPQQLQALRDPPPAPTPVRKDARPKPYTVEIPPAAPRFVSASKPDSTGRHESSSSRNDTGGRDLFSKGLYSGYADFFPWSGNHHEDEWSAEAIQKGTWDKGNQSETSSARLAIFPAIKQKSGLNALSTIFMGVLNQRRHRGQVTAPSTFKPPPRVTLTDTKREVWLKDLSNPAISLRRLSRTIPHGIRGRTLLDQCLNKNVPTERAVWLAKCVGANEIRAFKRKGVNGSFVLGGELKWIRDWTIFVEQFVDAVVSSFGDPDWRTKVTYAVRLATNLYSEHLLDRDHYLDWIMSGLENSPQSKLPMWLLIAQICWTDLLRLRKYGRRLVFNLLTHLEVIQNDPDRDILIQLSSRLSALLISLVKTNPSSFIYPSSWLKYRDTLKASLPIDDIGAQAAYDKINSRNARLLVASTASPPAGRQQLVKLLDLSLQNPIDQELSAKCWASSDDKKEVVRTLVEWGTSFHRPGLAKVYVAATLIRSWSPYGCGSTTVILGVLDDIPVGDQTRKNLAYHLVTELVRTGHFSVPQYIQWLIARGGYSDAAEIDPEDGPCATRLLVEMPIHCLSHKWRNERGNLLRRAGNFSVVKEGDDISMALKCVNHTLGLPLPDDDPMSQRKPMSLRKLLQRIGNSSKALQSCVGAHLRDTLAGNLPTNGDFVISLTMFTSVRAILESAEDFSMLSDVLQACSKASNPEVLACCADTVNANLAIFAALGAADSLFNILIERLKSISGDQGVVARPLHASLASLAQRMAGREEIAKQLHQELLQSDRNNAIDACSPVSDNNMVSQMQGGEAEVSEEIDKLLATGNTIDHPTMNRLFRNIVPKLEAGWEKVDDSRRVFASLLTRLRIFDMQHFDKIMADWVSHVRSLKNRPLLPDLFPLLVSLGCLSISTMLQTANATPSADDMPSDELTPHGSSTYLQELLQLVLVKLPVSASLSPEEAYRFHIHQQSAKSDHSKNLLILIRNSVVEYSRLQGRSTELTLPLDDLSCQDSILDTLRALVIVDSGAVVDALDVKTLPSEATGLIHKIMVKLLVLGGEVHSPQTSFDEILSLANELTMPFCQLKLDLDLSMVESIAATEGEEQGPSRFDLFAKAMDRAIEARNIMWTSMLPRLSDDITQHLKGQAHARFLELIPSAKSANLIEEATSEDRINLAGNLLGVAEAIISGQPPSKSAQLTVTLAEKLSDLWGIIAARDEGKAAVQTAVLDSWLPALLRFITLHSTSSESVPLAAPNPSVSIKAASLSQEARARIVLVLCSLLLELEALPGTAVDMLIQHVFDIAAVLADALSEELRANCAKAILLLPGGSASAHTSSDARIYYLLSASQPTAAENLMLAHRDKSSLPHSAAARGMGAMYGIGPALQERLSPFALRRWEVLSEPTPNVGENDTSLSLGLFEAIKIH